MASLFIKRRIAGGKGAWEEASKGIVPPPTPPPLTAATTAASEEGSVGRAELPEGKPPRVQVKEEGGGCEGAGKETKEKPELLDLVFAVDCTGSMASYIAAAQQNIRAIVDGIARKEGAAVRFGLVCYRDHPPQEATYVTTVFPFTAEIARMKAYVDSMAAAGGGDGPEAVADALFDVLHMEWRPRAAKVAVLIADAPPHGLGEACDGFPNGCPAGHDPLAIARQLAWRGITLYCVGCEPALSSFVAARDFLISLAELTSGMALRLESSALLAEVILGSAVEELALMRLQRAAAREIEGALDEGLSEATVVARVATALKAQGARCKQLRTTLRLHADAAPVARAISAAASLTEARTHVAARAAALSMSGDGGEAMEGPVMLGALGRSASSRGAGFVGVGGMMAADSSSATTFACSSCCASDSASAFASASASSFAPMAAMPAVAMAAAPIPDTAAPTESGSGSGSEKGGSGGFGPLISGLLSRRGGGGGGKGGGGDSKPSAAAPHVERGGSWGPQKWVAAAAADAAAADAAASASMAALSLSTPSSGGCKGGGEAVVEICEDAEVSADQVRRLVRKAASLRGIGFDETGAGGGASPVLAPRGVGAAVTL